MKIRNVVTLAAVALALVVMPSSVKADTGSADMYRLYNPNSGEHFYTADAAEKDNLTSVGWSYEGIGWVAPESSSVPVYRLYNSNAGDHHYTMDAGEKDSLVSIGWSYEGIGWYSSEAQIVPLYRQYNPNAVAGSHNYTTSAAENDALVAAGWNAEGTGWYGIGGATPVPGGPSSGTAVTDYASKLSATAYTMERSKYTYYELVVTNNSDKTLYIKMNASAYDASGKVLDAGSDSLHAVMSGRSVLLSTMFDTTGIDHFSYTLSAEEDKYYNGVMDKVVTSESANKRNVTVTATNTGTLSAEFLKASALFFKNGQLIYVSESYLVDDDYELKPGATLTESLGYYDYYDKGDYDDVKVYYTARNSVY